MGDLDGWDRKWGWSRRGGFLGKWRRDWGSGGGLSIQSGLELGDLLIQGGHFFPEGSLGGEQILELHPVIGIHEGGG